MKYEVGKRFKIIGNGVFAFAPHDAIVEIEGVKERVGTSRAEITFARQDALGV